MVLYSYEDEEILLGHMLDSQPNDLEFSAHMHENYELFCFVSGDADYMIEGRTWHLEYGNVLLMCPGESHRLILKSDQPYERYTVNFLIEALPRELRNVIRILENRPLEQRNFFEMRNFGGVTPIDLFNTVCRGNSENDWLKVRAVLPTILSLLCSNENEQMNEGSVKNDAAKMVDWINKHLFDPVTLPDVAAKFHRSISQTERIFNAATGTTVGKYCRTKRLLKARQMLNSGESAESVCAKCGFGDYSAFFKLYKKQFGCAPTDTKSKRLPNVVV